MYSNEHPPAAMGRAVPDLTLSCRLPGDRGSLEIRLRDRGGRWAMIAFLPPRRHHGCAGEIAALDAHANVLRARGCDVFAIATASEREDPVELGSPWHSSGGTVAMLRRVVDREGEIAGRFGVAPPGSRGGLARGAPARSSWSTPRAGSGFSCSATSAWGRASSSPRDC